MKVQASMAVQGTRNEVWDVATDIANAAEVLRGVEAIEVLHKPKKGLVGLRWRETRMYFGKPATVEKEVTQAVNGESYTTRSAMDGFLFLATLRLSDAGDSVLLTSVHETRPQGFVARLKGLPMVFFRGVLRKALLQDLEDLKTRVEQGPL